ncbi:MAG: hypothetical protein HYT72_02235 [Candidatus Aenigmarchaeota archaeon]|nr:hypothetical protein [Candidatus Aenigmarchaeota archaeon]
MHFLKVKDNRLYTPVVGYRRGDAEIVVAGMVHVGLPSYYSRIQAEIDKLPAGFFEGIRPPLDEAAVLPEKRPYIRSLDKLPDIYRTFARYLRMTDQKDSLTYNGWKNADMTATEFINMAPQRLLRRLQRLERIRDFEEAHKKHPEELSRFMKGMALFVYRFPFISNALSYAILGPMNHKLVVTERNRRLFHTMETEAFDVPVGVTYGAGHLPGIDRYLRGEGFSRDGDFWVPAWEVDEDKSFWESFNIVMKDSTETRLKRR